MEVESPPSLHTEFNVFVLQSRLSYSLLCSLNHFRSEIYPTHSTLFPDLVSSQNGVYPAAATEIHDHFTRLKVCEACGITTTP